MALPQAEVDLFRQALRDVNTIARRDLLQHWRTFDLTDALAAVAALKDVLPEIVRQHHLSAATVAADWYDLMRAEQGAPKRFQAVMAAEPDVKQVEALAGWGASPLFSADPNASKALTLIDGGLTRIVGDGARNTIIGSASKDPATVAWQRVGNGACAFCRMLIARGPLYSKTSVTFGSHEHCNCSAVPVFGGDPVPVKPYEPSSRNITDADRARVRDWIAANT